MVCFMDNASHIFGKSQWVEWVAQSALGSWNLNLFFFEEVLKLDLSR